MKNEPCFDFLNTPLALMPVSGFVLFRVSIRSKSYQQSKILTLFARHPDRVILLKLNEMRIFRERVDSESKNPNPN